MPEPTKQIEDYLNHLGTEKNYSVHTIKSYKRQLLTTLKDCKRYHSTKNPHVEKLVESDIDRYLLSMPLFYSKGQTLGSKITVLPREVYTPRMKVTT